MLLLSAGSLPESDALDYELKLNGFRAVAFRDGKTVRLRSRNDKDFSSKYPGVGASLARCRT